MRCGLRVSDATGLAFDCIVHDRDHAPYLRYFNHKMKREALVPIDEQLRTDISHQQQRVRYRYPTERRCCSPGL
jgi:integrase